MILATCCSCWGAMVVLWCSSPRRWGCILPVAVCCEGGVMDLPFVELDLSRCLDTADVDSLSMIVKCAFVSRTFGYN